MGRVYNATFELSLLHNICKSDKGKSVFSWENGVHSDDSVTRYFYI